MRRIAVTGARSLLGRRLLERLATAGDPGALVALDAASPEPLPAGVSCVSLDLASPGADQRLLELFRERRVDSVAHLAFHDSPRRDRALAHRLESVGTLNVLAAAAAAEVSTVALRSSTAVYGARADNGTGLAEEAPIHPDPDFAWVCDKVEAERHAVSFSRRYPAMRIGVLRFAPLVGAGVRSFHTALLSQRLIPVPRGSDPMVQLLHPDDAVAALERALERSPTGTVNIIPKSPIPLRTALLLAERATLPLPPWLLRALVGLLWTAGRSPAPAAFVDYARFPVVADGTRARRELGFEARYRSREALAAWLLARGAGTLSTS